ncbi:MAG TPA: DUF4139 domain-containing protein [Allosphingosinicella sp.]|nr:DUF4139 domain-containing protein [Allosphingosinicella sp.]
MQRLGFIALFAAAPALGQSAQGDLGVTIYQSDLALVQDVRQIDLPAGSSRQEFPDVSASIRPETVTLNGEGFGIAEQNFDFDLLSPTALMQKAVGQTVTLLRTNPATGAETRERATVLAVNGGVVLRIGDRIEVLRDDGLPVRVIFDDIPANLRARPTLSVTLETARAGRRPLTLSYLTTGLKWKADYVALFDERAGKVDVQGWITLTNATGTTFNNAATLLVAGDAAPVQGRRDDEDEPQGNSAGTESADRERIGDFYIYPIAGRTTIANAQTKQVSFLDASGAAAANSYEFRNPWLGAASYARSASTILKFSSARAGGLGDALPAGIVRVYMRDARGQAQFVGESPIPHTAMGSSLGLKTGAAFDVKVRPFVDKREKITPDEWQSTARYRIVEDGRVRTAEVQAQKEYWRSTLRYVLTNARPEPVVVDLIQGGLNPSWRDTRLISESLPGRQLGADERLWQVNVPANGEAVVTAVIDTRD